MSVVRECLKNWIPPAVTNVFRNLRQGGTRFEGPYGSWGEAESRCTGYGARLILEKVLDATLKVRRGGAVFERDSVVFDRAEYSWPVVAGLMWGAAVSGGSLRVLDFGGALGSSYFQYKKILNTLSDVHWGVVEQRHYVEVGLAHIQDEKLFFFATLEECYDKLNPNIILLSSVLQYLNDPYAILKKIDAFEFRYLIIDRTPFSNCEKIMIQKVPSDIYNASYPMWVLEEKKILALLSNKWNLVDFLSCPEGKISLSSCSFEFKGMILERKVAC